MRQDETEFREAPDGVLKVEWVAALESRAGRPTHPRVNHQRDAQGLGRFVNGEGFAVARGKVLEGGVELQTFEMELGHGRFEFPGRAFFEWVHAGKAHEAAALAGEFGHLLVRADVAFTGATAGDGKQHGALDAGDVHLEKESFERLKGVPDLEDLPG